MALEKFEVTGIMSIRDALTKESVPTGGIVTLDTEPVARKDDFGRPVKPLAATMINGLIASGAIKRIEAAPKARKD